MKPNPRQHGPECSMYSLITCIHCGHHADSHDRTTTECRWRGCNCEKFKSVKQEQLRSSPECR